MFQRMVNSILILLLLTSNYSVYALSTDKEQVMRLMADSADLNQKQHQGTYVGHVELIQGSTNLLAAKAITQVDDKNQIIVAIAHGDNKKQAHYWTITDPKKPPFHAYADLIHYYPARHFIELIGHARVEQGKDSFSAAKISYDTLKQQVLSQGDGKERITIISLVLCIRINHNVPLTRKFTV